MAKKDPNHRLCGVGINDVDYKVRDCPYYARWRGILKRCYSESSLSSRPSYRGCSICEEWVYFSTFKAWMETQDWEGKHLDKDLLKKGNKVYSPDTCVFVDNKTNSFLALFASNTKKSGLPIGVSHRHNRYVTQASDGNSKLCILGLFDSIQEAHQAWKIHKLEVLEELMAEQTDSRIIESLLNIKEVLIRAIELKEEVTKITLTGKE